VALSLVPVMVLYVFAQKYLIEGITLTGIKG
jgi:ABC-type maltose transport system permease subunit